MPREESLYPANWLRIAIAAVSHNVVLLVRVLGPIAEAIQYRSLARSLPR